MCSPPPLLRDIAPEFAAELAQRLVEAGETALADQIADLAVQERCRCGADFCASFYTVKDCPRPFPKGFRTLALVPGGLHLDVLGPTILQVEVLYRDDVRAKLHAAVP